MRFEQSVEINASQQRVWDVLSDLESWPNTVDTIEDLEILTPPPLDAGGRVRLRQPKVPEGVWTVTEWTPPFSFEWQQKERGVTSAAGHRVEALGPDRSRLVLTLEMRGLVITITGRLFKNMIRDYMQREAEGLKCAAEAPSG